MGIPALFKWVSLKYPRVITNAAEDRVKFSNGEVIYPDPNDPNPNCREYDNLFLDMNGVIHPCCHPNDRIRPMTREDMFKDIFRYIDRIFLIVRPKRLVYMAVDGVAPRAKMNQQRSRRFKSVKESRIAEEERAKSREEYIREYPHLAHEIERRESIYKSVKSRMEEFDSNCISPGTEFMYEFSVAIKGYVLDRVANNPAWSNIRVIISDSNCPGEGEHKIMSYIRSQRTMTDYDPNMWNVIHGLDADIIMLSLATHEANFVILREDLSMQNPRAVPCFICNTLNHGPEYCMNEYLENPDEDPKPVFNQKIPMIFVNVFVLKEYLDSELRFENNKIGWDIERAVDDWIFLCFFVGNDFLPSLPSLDIREDAIDMAVAIWKDCIKDWDDYLTNSGSVSIKKLIQLMKVLGTYEKKIFSERHERDVSINKSINARSRNPNPVPAPADDIKLWDNGGMERYYSSKFNVSTDDIDFRASLAEQYAVGLCWVLKYYFQGCPSWDWYYPKHYSPFSSDFNLLNTDKELPEPPKSEPCHPYEQLLSIMPPQSWKLIPEELRQLVIDEKSPIKEFYPESFETDLNGKRYEWQSIALLNFVDKKRLHEAFEPLYKNMPEQTLKMARPSINMLVVGDKDSLKFQIREISSSSGKSEISAKKLTKNPIFGYIKHYAEFEKYVEENRNFWNKLNLKIPNEDFLYVAEYEDVDVSDPGAIRTRLLDGAICHPPILTPIDLQHASDYTFYRKRSKYETKGFDQHNNRQNMNRHPENSYNNRNNPENYYNHQNTNYTFHKEYNNNYAHPLNKKTKYRSTTDEFPAPHMQYSRDSQWRSGSNSHHYDKSSWRKGSYGLLEDDYE